MRTLLFVIVSISVVVASYGQALPAAGALVAPGHGQVRAFVIGIDDYLHVNALKGAVADAHDIEAALRKMGAKDVTALVNGDADRASILQRLSELLARTHSGDLVLLSLAGHGSREAERIKGSSADGSDEVFLLGGFDPKTGPGGAEKILNHEFNHYVKAFEDRGAQVILVADTCYGGGLAREIAVGSPGMSFRQVPRYRLAEDDLKPVSTAADAMLTQLDFRQTTFLAAVDSQTKAPEVMIDGQFRGALSYAVARAIEGAADARGDGRITRQELFGYVRKVVYQLSDERQSIVTVEPPGRDLDREVVLEFGTEGAVNPPTEPALEHPVVAGDRPVPVRVASLSGRVAGLATLAPLSVPFVIVPLDADPDVTWDPVAKEAFSGGDKIALDVVASDLPGIVDRTAALRQIKKLVVDSPQTIRVSPDASLHSRGSKVDVEVADAENRTLILLDLTGSGTIQMLYPTELSRPMPVSTSYKMSFAVRAPFGADEVIAITSAQHMTDLEAALNELNGRKGAGRLAATIARFAPPGSRVGVVGLFTIP